MTFADYMKKSLVYGQDKDTRRVKVSKGDYGDIIVTVDLHGMQKEAARQLIKRIIELNSFGFSLEVIHGFNHGTVLRNMVNKEIKSIRIVDRYSDPWNPGSTYLTIV